jgi:hypothetical protein
MRVVTDFSANGHGGFEILVVRRDELTAVERYHRMHDDAHHWAIE